MVGFHIHQYREKSGLPGTTFTEEVKGPLMPPLIAQRSALTFFTLALMTSAPGAATFTPFA